MTGTVRQENPHAGQGAVLLDIGGDVGALIVTMPAAMEGTEVEIRPTTQRHDADHHPHVAVVNRPVRDTYVASLVFPELVAGRYELCEKGAHDVRLTVEILGGEVTDATWPP
jgi:hypothetical protein